MVEAGEFREDLMYRLRVVELELPPLRQRGDDVLRLAEAFLRDAAPGGARISAESEELLRAHDWPGNVRELRNAMERAAIFCLENVVRPEDLPSELRLAGGGPAGPAAASDGGDGLGWQPGDDFQEAKKSLIERFERAVLQRALEVEKGNVSQAARLLGLHRQNLQQKLKALDISPADYRS
jgi:DNA-binding NtrC family response regulator